MADRLAARTGLGKSVAKEAVDGAFAAIGDALANGEDVRIAGFGTFGTRSRPARTGRNPRTGEAISISASTQRFLVRHRMTRKTKTGHASERDRADVLEHRQAWRAGQADLEKEFGFQISILLLNRRTMLLQ